MLIYPSMISSLLYSYFSLDWFTHKLYINKNIQLLSFVFINQSSSPLGRQSLQIFSIIRSEYQDRNNGGLSIHINLTFKHMNFYKLSKNDIPPFNDTPYICTAMQLYNFAVFFLSMLP